MRVKSIQKQVKTYCVFVLYFIGCKVFKSNSFYFSVLSLLYAMQIVNSLEENVKYVILGYNK